MNSNTDSSDTFISQKVLEQNEDIISAIGKLFVVYLIHSY
jgi:hypothetical protein